MGLVWGKTNLLWAKQCWPLGSAQVRYRNFSKSNNLTLSRSISQTKALAPLCRSRIRTKDQNKGLGVQKRKVREFRRNTVCAVERWMARDEFLSCVFDGDRFRPPLRALRLRLWTFCICVLLKTLDPYWANLVTTMLEAAQSLSDCVRIPSPKENDKHRTTKQ
jgi:hypothetical protein